MSNISGHKKPAGLTMRLGVWMRTLPEMLFLWSVLLLLETIYQRVVFPAFGKLFRWIAHRWAEPAAAPPAWPEYRVMNPSASISLAVSGCVDFLNEISEASMIQTDLQPSQQAG